MSLNISTIRAIFCTGGVADGLGRLVLDACAAAAGAVISVPYGSRLHTGQAFWPSADRATSAAYLVNALTKPAIDRTPGARAFVTACLALQDVPPADELRAAAGEMLERMEEALEVHIYSADDGEKPEADCQYVASIERVRKALGLIPSGIETLPADAAVTL